MFNLTFILNEGDKMGRRTSMTKIREILRIHIKNPDFSERQISKLLNVSRPVVNKAIKDFKKTKLSFDEFISLSDDEILDLINNNNICKSDKYRNLSERFPHMLKELKKVGVNRRVLWEEYREEFPNGYSYSQFNYHFQVWRDSLNLTMHIEHKAGDKMFIDFTGKKMSITDRITGESREVEIFISVLGASQLTYVEAVMSQKKEDFIGATENAFLYCEGVPKAIVPDCLKSAVTKADKYEPDLNPEYFDFARHYDTVIIPARSRHPQDKAYVENAVKISYSWIFAPLRNMTFYSLSELNKAIQERLEIYNSRKMQRYDLSRRELFEQTEKNVLKKLPKTTYEKKSFKKLKVHFNYHILLSEDKHHYSVPYHYAGKTVDVVYIKDNVEIFHNHKRIAFHRRSTVKGGYSTTAEHMHKNHKWISEWSPQRFIGWASKLGVYVEEYIKGVLEAKKHPEQAYKSCLGILNLSKKYSEGRLNNACKRAIHFEYYSFKGVKNILDNNFDLLKEDEDSDKPLPNHENIRGNKYYTKEIIN